jgi:hypothetical protein
MDWETLFERTSEDEVTVEAVREALAEQRET